MNAAPARKRWLPIASAKFTSASLRGLGRAAGCTGLGAVVGAGPHGRVGLPVAPGTVAAVAPGQMADQRIRRIYHPAITAPIPGTNHSDGAPAAIAASVPNVSSMAQ